MNRWEDRPGYWKRSKYEGFATDVWYPAHQRKRSGKLYEDKHITNQVQHNLGVTDSYIAFYPHTFEDGSPVMTAWQRGEESPYHEEVHPDDVMTLFGVEFLDEEECGNHNILGPGAKDKVKPKTWEDSFNFKMGRYMNFLGKHPEKRLMIRVQVWLGRKYDKAGTDELFDNMLDYLATLGHKDKILVARHRDVSGDPDHTEGEIHHDDLGDPLGAVWFSPADPDEPVTIQQFLRTSNHGSNRSSK